MKKKNKERKRIKNKKSKKPKSMPFVPFRRGSFAFHIGDTVRDHLLSEMAIISGLGIICGRGSFAALYNHHKHKSAEKQRIKKYDFISARIFLELFSNLF